MSLRRTSGKISEIRVNGSSEVRLIIQAPVVHVNVLEDAPNPTPNGPNGPVPSHRSHGPLEDDDYHLPDRTGLVQTLVEDLSARYAGADMKETWKETAEIVEEYSKDMIDEWYAEIDALPVFAGLFATALSALIVETIKLLQPPVGVAVPAYAVWVNSLWFFSLVGSFSSASVGIIVKQWLNAFKSGLLGNSRETARRRQYRLNSLKRWKVSMIVAVLPILLQLALILFLIGLVILLWNLHKTVAIVVTVPVAILIVFTCATTILPVISNNCCYHSPQAFAAFATWETAKSLLRGALAILYSFRGAQWQSDLEAWVSVKLPARERLNRWAGRLAPSKWRSGEASAIAEAEQSTKLDGDTLIMAYTTTWDAERFDGAQACLFDLSDLDSIIRYVTKASDILLSRWHWDPFKWPLYARESYRELLNRAIQISLVTIPETTPEKEKTQKWKKTQEWILEVILTRLIPTPRSAHQAQSSTDKPPPFPTSIWGPTAEFFNYVHYLAVVSMGSEYDERSARRAWRGLRVVCERDTRKPGDVLEQEPVITALVHRFTQSERRLNDGDPTDDARELVDYIDALLLSMRCVARPAKETGSPLFKQTVAHVSAALSSLRILTSKQTWRRLCKRHWGDVRYKDIIDEATRLLDYEHSRSVVDPTLVDALSNCLDDIEGALPNNAIVSQCRDALGALRRSVPGAIAN